MGERLMLALFAVLPMLVWAQDERKYDSGHPPRFEEFSVSEKWQPPSAVLKLSIPSERMFKTRLTRAATAEPNFAGHYRMTYWGCGSYCAAAALIDLQTGEVLQPPMATVGARGWDRWIQCGASFEGSGEEFRLDSRLMIVRCGGDYSERLQKHVPDPYYFVLERGRFRRLLLQRHSAPHRGR